MCNIAVFLGSTRPGRVGEAVARRVCAIAQRRTDANFQLIDIEDVNLPLLDEPIPPSRGQDTRTDRRFSPKRTTPRAGAAVCAILMLVAACDTPTTPSADVSGDWEFTFSAFDLRSCPGEGGFVRGCAGSGRLEFLVTTPQIAATHSYRAFCQSCEGAADYGVFEQPLRTARLTGGVVEFTLAACRFTAALPATPAPTVAGTVACRPNQPPGLEVSGNWTMSRR